ncbi:hypothetical protein Cantr_05607 [Candida viswanathii]|uniref:BZIP domain-containing protein n=1 Tax=Candida viswanathii TaxID=5486 RepID=A0A367XSK1_9ASCO|nr:hypothetical protein Cantr_05607 [Candida viswanathii]
MPPKGPNIVPRQAQSPIAIAGSPPSSSSSGSTPRTMASPNIAVSARSPPAVINNTPTMSNGSNNLVPKQVTTIQTSKDWVLPPRPKPGRKPSVDTPASKRKAQNRAAQRAFRERRATRVQELEQRLLEVEKERDIKEMALVGTINKLKVENQFLVKNMEQLKQELNQLKHTTMRAQVQQQPPQPVHNHPHASSSNRPSPQAQPLGIKTSYSFNTSRPGSNHPSPHSGPHSAMSPASSSYSLQQISPAPSADLPPNFYTNANIQSSRLRKSSLTHLTPISNNTTPAKTAISANDNNNNTDNFDCGVCLKDNCLCESVGLKDVDTNKKSSNPAIEKELQNQLNSFKPMAAVSLSRKRKVKSIEEEQEIDFTKQFSTKAKPMPDLKKLKKTAPAPAPQRTDNDQLASSFNEASPVDNCGFCSDDTPCVCREAAKEAAKLNNYLNNPQPAVDDVLMGGEEDDDDHRTLPPIQSNNRSHNFRKSSLPVMHPGPTIEIREFSNISAVPNVLAGTEPSTPGVTTSTSNNPSSKESSSDSGCTGNPGTCRQCQMDPMSTLFCTTVASRTTAVAAETVTPMRQLSRTNSKSTIPINSLNNPQSPVPPPLLASNPSSNTINTISTNNSNGGHTGGSTTPSTPSSATAAGNGGMFIPCADAYKTLSRHKKFNSMDFSTMVGKLTTRGMQVEVQSVANVIRELDRRLYN